MLKSMYSAVSGMSVNQSAMDVIGSNIANVNTIGFKMGRAVFEDLMSQTLSGARAPSGSMGGINPMQIGSGATLAGIDTVFVQGSMDTTQVPNNLGIAGEGFFVVSGGGGQNSYTRAGDFNFDVSGTLVTPSGYKVQGWMHDSVTGDVINDGITSDIVLGDEYKVMLSKESTEVNIAGVLDTRATPSTLEYPMFMTQALGNQSIFDLSNSSGVDLGISKGDTITIKSHITNNTNMGEIVGSSGQTIGLQNGNFIMFTMKKPDGIETLTYDATGSSNPDDGKFTTVEEFIAEANYMFKKIKGSAGGSLTPVTPAANLSIVEGKFVLDGNSSFSIDSVSGTGILTDLLGGLTGSYVSGQKRSTGELFVQEEVVAGTDFATMDDFAAEVNGAINGQVVDNGFLAEFLDNNFGMSDGESINVGAKVMVITSYKGGVEATLVDDHTLSATTSIKATSIVTLGGNMNTGVTKFSFTGNAWDVKGGNIILGGIMNTTATTTGANGMITGDPMVLSGTITMGAGSEGIKLGGPMTIPVNAAGAAMTWSPFATGATPTTIKTTGSMNFPSVGVIPAGMVITVGDPVVTYNSTTGIPAGTNIGTGAVITFETPPAAGAAASLSDFKMPTGATLGAGFTTTSTISAGFTIPPGTYISKDVTLTGVELSKGTTVTNGTTLNTVAAQTLPENSVLTAGFVFSATKTMPTANSLPIGLELPEGTKFTPDTDIQTTGFRDIEVPLKYTNQPGPQQGTGTFNTVSELARELAYRLSNLNASLKLGDDGFTPGFDKVADVAESTKINYGMSGNAFILSYAGGAPLQLGESTMHPAPGGDAPNPFLKTILDASFTRISSAGGTISNVELDSDNKNVTTEDIDGTGRLSYTYSATTENSLIDLSNPGTDLGMIKGSQGTPPGTSVPGDTITFNFGVDQITIMYTTDPDVVGGFSTVAEMEGAINEALDATPGYSELNFKGDFDQTPPTFEFSTASNASFPFGKVTSTSVTPALGNLFNTAVRGTVVRLDAPIVGSAIVANVPSITGLEFTSSRANSNFTKNLFEENIANNGISLGRSTVSDVFLAVADEDTKISDLYSDQGAYLGFSETNTNITFDASVGDEKVNNPNFFNVTTETDVQDLMDAMEKYLNLDENHNEFGNVFMKDGKINVVGEKGVSNNIDFFKLDAPATPGFAGFNNYISRVTQTTATGGFGTTGLTIYDEQGNPHLLKFDFSLANENNNEWKMEISTPEEFNSVSINGARTNEVTIKFNPDGTIAYVFDDTQTPVAILNDLKLDYNTSNGTNSINDISLNIGNAGEQGGLIIQGSSGYFSRSDTDGYALGSLKTTSFNEAGELVGTYTNGQIRTLAQLALATFTNQQGLERAGDTMFQETSNSGQPSIGRAQTGSKGKIMSGNLERSNVDLSREMVDMIITQRGFQSNSRVVTTSDEMIQEVLNMKR